MRVAVSGATGLLGRTLARELLERGDQVVALGRSAERVAALLPGARALAWDVLVGPPPPEAVEEVDAFVHLAGEPIVDRRWSEAHKRRAHDSRILGTANLVAAARQASRRPAALVCASAVGYYGDRGDELLSEAAGPGDDFLSRLCAAWEAEAARASDLGIRVVRLRTGIVLAREGGALPVMARPFRFFVGGPLGSGQQWMPWIHLADQVGLIRHTLDRADLSGPINLVAPHPVRNRVFASTLGRVLGRPALMPAPRPALELVLGERAGVVLSSQRVQPAVAEATGYRFRFAELAPALRDLFDR